MQAIVLYGRVRRRELVDRGALLCYDQAEWQARTAVENSRDMRFYGVMAVLFVVWTLFRMWRINTLGPHVLDSLVTLIYFLVAAVLAVAFTRRLALNLNPPAVPGLYEYGIQLPTHVFVPYLEIGKIEREPSGIIPSSGGGRLRLRCRFARRPYSSSDGWVVSRGFLGDRGLLQLKERLELARGLRVYQPPVTVYGQGGVVGPTRRSGPAR